MSNPTLADCAPSPTSSAVTTISTPPGTDLDDVAAARSLSNAGDTMHMAGARRPALRGAIVGEQVRRHRAPGFLTRASEVFGLAAADAADARAVGSVDPVIRRCRRGR